MRIVDLRSDTVTKPTQEMREAMFKAEVGDDVYEEDPTVRSLEEAGAKKLGFSAGLFVASGTMGNLVALLTHTQKGDEVVLEAESHIYYYEVGGLSALAGAIPRLIPGKRGKLTPQLLDEYCRPENIHFPNTKLLCMENTHNRGGGSVTRPEEMKGIVNFAKQRDWKIHIDGARIFNAAVACNCDVKELVQGVDSVQLCLSKGLGAPVGSLLVGSEEYIKSARKWRKMVGGGFRQIGVVAAAGLVALNKMVDRLGEDHNLAKILAEGMNKLSYLEVDLEEVETNIVVARIDSTVMSVEDFLAALSAQGIKANARGGSAIRFVTHKDISEADIWYTLEIMGKLTK